MRGKKIKFLQWLSQLVLYSNSLLQDSVIWSLSLSNLYSLPGPSHYCVSTPWTLTSFSSNKPSVSPSWYICISCGLLSEWRPLDIHLANGVTSSFSVYKERAERSLFLHLPWHNTTCIMYIIWLCVCVCLTCLLLLQKITEGRDFVLFTTVSPMAKTVSCTR